MQRYYCVLSSFEQGISLELHEVPFFWKHKPLDLDPSHGLLVNHPTISSVWDIMQVDEPCMIVGENWPAEEPLPVSTWYDDAQHHFVALLERRLGSPPPALSELVEYRILALIDSTVHSSPLLLFRLPQSLAREEYRVATGELLLTRRIPLVAKFSLDHKLLAIQFSSTLLRIIPLGDDKNSKHWTIDLSTSGEPISSAAHTVPLSRYKVHESLNCKDSFILPGGVIWSDHGGNSQDLVVVTTKSLLCYKISLLRNQMAATHSFPHPLASAVWWEPVTRTIMVGSYGQPGECQNESDKNRNKTVLQLRTFQLRFPRTGKSKRLPRFELPPPRRLAPFAVGLSRLSDYSNSDPLITPADVGLVNLYGNAYAIEQEWDNSGLQISFYRLDHTLGGTLFKTYVIEGMHLTKKDMETMIISVLDNILCVSLRKSRKNIFMDIADVKSSYFIDELDGILAGLESPNISFVLPSFLLDPTGRGSVIPVSVDLEKLSSTLPQSPSVAPFFLRRSSPRSHEIALSKFAEILNLISARERRQAIESVVQFYVMDQSALVWDLKASMTLIYKCGLLPPGSEFRHYHVDIDTAIQDHGVMPSPSVLYQKEILGQILLPRAKRALANSCASDLHLVVDIAVTLLGALERQHCPTCPALECFIVAILWRLGCSQEIASFLQSRNTSLSRSDGRNSHKGMPNNCIKITPTVINNGTLVLTNMMIAITEEVDFGVDAFISGNNRAQFSRNHRMRELLLSEATKLLSSRVSDVRIIVNHLLSRGRLLEAMATCSTHLVDGGFEERHSSSIHKKQVIDGEGFFRTAISLARIQEDDVDRCRLFYCLNSFLSRWGSDCMLANWQSQRRVGDRAIFDDATRNSLLDFERCTGYIQRRPSSRCLLVMSKPDEKSLGCHASVCQHSLASVFEPELDLLFRNIDGELRDHIRRMFGLAIR